MLGLLVILSLSLSLSLCVSLSLSSRGRQWIVGVISFQKIFGLCGLRGHKVEIRWDVTIVDNGQRTECEDRAILKQNLQKTKMAKNHFLGTVIKKISDSGRAMVRGKMSHFVAFFVHFDKLIRPHPGPLWGGLDPCPDGLGHFFREDQMGICLVLGGSKPLPEWFGALF